MRKPRTVTPEQLGVLHTAATLINIERQHVRTAGALRAAAAIGRALKSLDGAIRHAQRMAQRNGGTAA